MSEQKKLTKQNNILWIIVAVVVIAFCAYSFLTSDLEHIEDTNGPDNYALAVITDEDIVKQEMGSDPASVAFDTVKSAVAKNADVVIIDTAGRLHNRIDLMNELTKIRNVMRKVIPDAPHEVLLVLDGSTGQNAFQQAKEFARATDITALAITKLDGTAKGGVVVGIVDQFRVPIKFVGIGEGIDDLKVFNKREFVKSLFSKEDLEN